MEVVEEEKKDEGPKPFEDVLFKDIAGVMEKSIEEKKYVVLWDNHGKVPFFFGYKANMIDFHKEMVKVAAEQ